MMTNATDSNLINEQWESDPSTLRAWIDNVEQRVSRTHPEWILKQRVFRGGGVGVSEIHISP